MTVHYPLAEWRLLLEGAHDGATNMAIDEAILEAVSAGSAPPTLRFYRWEPPCISLGFRQPAEDIDREHCSQEGWDLVRRPTGGRAILHMDELTYSVAAPEGEPRVGGGVVESYRRLAAGLLAGLSILGLQPAESRPDYPVGAGEQGPVCFDGPARHEITLPQLQPDGATLARKLIGSAQARRKGCVLQHGALPLWGDITRIVDGLRFASPGEREAARVRLQARAMTLESGLGRRVAFEEAAEAMRSGFEQALNLALLPGELTATEREAVQRLYREKYAHDGWTLKR